MINMNPVLKILVENAMTFSERNEIYSLTESEMTNVNNTMVSNLYKSAIEKSHVDFEDIPDSKGDITRYSGYKSMVESLEIINDIASKNGVKVAEYETVSTAISNIASYRELFEKGFRLDKEFIQLQYNSLVYASVEAVSVLISSYVDFVKRPDRIDFTIIKNKHIGGSLAIQSLEKFNLSVKKGDFAKTLNGVINTGSENLLGVDDIVIPTLIIGGVLVLVPLIRELMFLFYYSRMKLSDYLNQQASLIDINKQSVLSSNLPAREKNEIIKKQASKIDQLHRLSERIKVDRTMAENKATIELSKQNKSFTIGDVQSQSASTDTGGFQLL